MTEKLSRRDVIKKSVKAGLVIGGVAAVGTAGYKLFSSKSIDEVYGPYPEDSKLKPNIPVILVSGYDLAHVMEGDHPELPQAFLAKPYNLKALRAAISQALESRKT